MTALERRDRPMLAPMFGDLFDWLEELPGRPVFRPVAGMQAIRVEDYLESNQYVLRAELPGVDPTKDVEITVADGVLTLRAERREETREGHRSEFRYGALVRSIRLPQGANEDDVTASYTNGLLEVRVGIPEAKTEAKRIAVSTSRK